MHHNPEALKQAREAAGLKQSALAAAARISPGFLSELESGQRGASPDTLGRIAKVLAIDVAMLERPKSHTCPACSHSFDLPSSRRVPVHQAAPTGAWCPIGNTCLTQLDAA